MLFRKNIDPRCAYCQHGNELDEDRVLCPKKGVVSKDWCCKKYKYDIFKREPKLHPTAPEFSKSDFEI